ncbi:hypothetical protein KIN20_036726 [Parelaphostrongylus tenuis]|uniref:Uncharacterized protein n=1 Tax=Parelaphostrongylus tenuis TaxID=148309 RepID=A0AAD5WKN5_PARTN|nr:hypothetical protein KIN20_036726 [Parelaphostrongylus tenuis]
MLLIANGLHLISYLPHGNVPYSLEAAHLETHSPEGDPWDTERTTQHLLEAFGVLRKSKGLFKGFPDFDPEYRKIN